MDNNLNVEWIDSFRDPQNDPNPDYPNGIDFDVVDGIDTPACYTDLPYPAKRCGRFVITCRTCDLTVMVTTAGRPDDPKSIRVPCKRGGAHG